MFYADSIAALLAWRRIEARRQGELSSPPVAPPPHVLRRRRQSGNDNGLGHM
jgi:hypothetical protein